MLYIYRCMSLCVSFHCCQDSVCLHCQVSSAFLSIVFWVCKFVQMTELAVTRWSYQDPNAVELWCYALHTAVNGLTAAAVAICSVYYKFLPLPYPCLISVHFHFLFHSSLCFLPFWEEIVSHVCCMYCWKVVRHSICTVHWCRHWMQCRLLAVVLYTLAAYMECGECVSLLTVISH